MRLDIKCCSKCRSYWLGREKKTHGMTQLRCWYLWFVLQETSFKSLYRDFVSHLLCVLVSPQILKESVWINIMLVDRASLYLFWAAMRPSLAEITASMRHLLFVSPYGLLSGMLTRQSSIRNNKYQVSWWWAHNRPKHVKKRNKHTKKNCAQIWFYLQDVWMKSQYKLKARHSGHLAHHYQKAIY
jgi:hypothetical protein